MAISKGDLVGLIQGGANCSKTAAENTYDTLITAIQNAIAIDGEAVVRGLGVFKLKSTPARQGRNPRTGEQIDIPAGHRITFNAGKALKERLPAA